VVSVAPQAKAKNRSVHVSVGSLLLAFYQTKSDDLATASGDVNACVENELDLHPQQSPHRLWIAQAHAAALAPPPDPAVARDLRYRADGHAPRVDHWLNVRQAYAALPARAAFLGFVYFLCTRQSRRVPFVPGARPGSVTAATCTAPFVKWALARAELAVDRGASTGLSIQDQHRLCGPRQQPQNTITQPYHVCKVSF